MIPKRRYDFIEKQFNFPSCFLFLCLVSCSKVYNNYNVHEKEQQ